jgi:hypothetical protein
MHDTFHVLSLLAVMSTSEATGAKRGGSVSVASASTITEGIKGSQTGARPEEPSR